MRTLQEDIDDLDRLVDGDAAKDKIRSQIRLIAREVAALQKDHGRLAEAHAKVRSEKEDIEKQISDAKATRQRELRDALDRIARQRAELGKSDNLDHNA
jgi:predicted  nucleic acid-binding Zn-ribbon protein